MVNELDASEAGSEKKAVGQRDNSVGVYFVKSPQSALNKKGL